MGACTFINVRGIDTCKEDFSGVGSRFYIFDGSDISSEDWDLKAVNNIEGFEGVIRSAINGKKLYEVNIKPKSGKVTATSTPNGGGFSNVFTGVIAKNMQKMSELARSLNNSNDWGIIVPAGGGQYYVLYDKDYGIEFQMESDSGDAADSDHGHTVTMTCGPMLYAMPKFSLSISGSGDNLVAGGAELTALVTFQGPDGVDITAVDENNDKADVQPGDQVTIGHVITLTATQNVKWPDGSIGTMYVTTVDRNGVHITARNAE